MPCLDTDFLVALNRGDVTAINKLQELEKLGEKLSVAPPSVTELFKGAFKTGKERNVQEIEEMLINMAILDYDFYAAKESGKLLNLLYAKGTQIGDMDTLIGAIALRHGETLLTRNAKHFAKILGLKVEKW